MPQRSGNDARTQEPTPVRGNRKEITLRSSRKTDSSVRNATQQSIPNGATITNDTIRKDSIRKEDVHKKSKRVLYS